MQTPSAREQGSVLIEVVVTATLLVVVALGVLKAFDAADARGAEQKAKAVAGNVAQAEQERLRSLTLDVLSNYHNIRTETQNGADYLVESRAAWVTDETGEANCATGSAADYLKITTTVTSRSLRGRKPVTLDSILSPPARAFKQTEGSLAVQVTDRNGQGVPGLTLDLAGPENVSGVTNDQGCVLWGYLTAAPDYRLTYSRSGWIDPSGATSISSTQGVVGEQTRNVVFTYDEGGSLRADFVTRHPTDGTVVRTAPQFATIQHPGPPSTQLSYPVSGDRIDTPALFPFNSDYAIYADNCTAGRPASPTFETVAPGPITDAGPVQLPALDIWVTDGFGNAIGSAEVHVTSACGTKYVRRARGRAARGSRLPLGLERHDLRERRRTRRHARLGLQHAARRPGHRDVAARRADGHLLMSRARGEAGFTLHELLVAMTVGIVVLFGALGLLETTTKLSARTNARVEATATARRAMDLVTRQIRSQVCLSGDAATSEPALVDARPDELTFYASLAPESPTLTIQKRTIKLNPGPGGAPGTITETVQTGNGSRAKPDFSNPATTKVLAERIVRDPAKPLFRYYRFVGAAGVAVPSLITTAPPLPLADRERTVQIEINVAALGRQQGATPVAISNKVYVRTASPAQPELSPLCL